MAINYETDATIVDCIENIDELCEELKVDYKKFCIGEDNLFLDSVSVKKPLKNVRLSAVERRLRMWVGRLNYLTCKLACDSLVAKGQQMYQQFYLTSIRAEIQKTPAFHGDKVVVTYKRNDEVLFHVIV